jgi:IS1 family transposase
VIGGGGDVGTPGSLPGLPRDRPDQVGPRLRPAALAVQGLRPAVHPHHTARQAGRDEASGGEPLLHGPVDERDQQAPGRLGAERHALDQGPCAAALPQAGTGRARNRGRNRRGLALRSKKIRKLWIWKAFERGTSRLIDWECGGRDQATLERLLGRLQPWSVRLFCTDDWAAYDAALPAGRHYIGKDQMQRSESNNARQRHWFARFRRRTCVVSKSLEMVEATMALFAYYHCNGGHLTSALLR